MNIDWVPVIASIGATFTFFGALAVLRAPPWIWVVMGFVLANMWLTTAPFIRAVLRAAAA